MTLENLNYRTNPLFLRNQFISSNSYGIPEIPKSEFCDNDFKDLRLLAFNSAKSDNGKHCERFVHFFLYDYNFESVWKNPEKFIEVLSKYKGVLTPDFSMYTEMPYAVQIYNTFRNRWCGAYLASKGIKVIPTVNWSDKGSFDFCFKGIPCIKYLEHRGKKMKTKYLKYTLIFIIILLIAIYAINEAHSPKNKMKTFLETQDYESITFYKVIDSGPSNTPDDINISFTVDSTDDLIKNVFSVKVELESYLKDNENNFKNSNVRVSFYDDSIPLSITISNQGDDDYKSDNYYELDYGFFACRDLDISEFNNAPQFDVLLLNHFKDYNDVSALDSMDSLEKLIMYNENDDVVTDIDYLIEKHPDCTIICNCETVYEPTKDSE